MPDKQELEHKIARATLELIALQGVKKTTMDEVAEGAGVTRATVYRHFDDKKSLIRAAITQVAGFGCPNC